LFVSNSSFFLDTHPHPLCGSCICAHNTRYARHPAFCTPNLQHFTRRIFCILHAESSAFYTPNLQHFARRIFSILHAESSAFYTPNLLLFARRILFFWHTKSSTFFAPRLSHPEPLILVPKKTYHDYHNIPTTGYQVVPMRTNESPTQ
jgi:hypothetical protein